MPSLFSKDDDLRKTAPILGGEVLKLLKNADTSKVSIFDLAKEMTKTKGVNARSIYYAMLFLYSLDIIDFHEPYVTIKC